MNGSEQTSRGERQSFIINSPGEYEVDGVFVKGLASKTNYGGEEKINTIYYVSLEGMNLCFLGSLGDANLSAEAKGAIEDVDILFTPISGEGVLDPSEAYKLAVSLEPSVVIPMNFDDKTLKLFLKEGGGESKPVDKLTIKKKDLEGKESEIVVLDAQ
jgi:L-ascorbate metabolism protein UlaG (beta-lactamase superfamily)